MTPDLSFEALLVSRDPSVICPLKRLLDELSIRTIVCLSSSKALKQLSEGSTDLIIVDCENSVGELLGIFALSGRPRPTVVAVAALDGPLAGVHVVIPKPVTTESSSKALKLAYSLMLRDYRRTARHVLMSSARATDQANQTRAILITDIGDGGVGISSKDPVSVGDTLSFRITLPDTVRAIAIHAAVEWTRDYGVAGCRFLRIPPVDLDILHDWLKRACKIKKPFVSA